MIDIIDPKLLRLVTYARKSNEQDADRDFRSVEVQDVSATAFTKAKRWPKPFHVYADDGISGAEFLKRHDLQKLLADARTPLPVPRRDPFTGDQTRRPVDVVLMSEPSRLGREMMATQLIVQELTELGIRVVNYRSGDEIRLDTAEQKLLFSVHGFLSERERELTSERVSMARNARIAAGQIIAPPTYGYVVVGAVLKEINPDEAVVVVRIFQRQADGAGAVQIAKELNDDGIPPPRSGKMYRKYRAGGKHGRWQPASIRAIVERELYRGIWITNKTRRAYVMKADATGRPQRTAKIVARPEADWIRVPKDHLRIVSDVLWQRAHAARVARRTLVPPGRRPHDQPSKHLLVGVGRCGICGGTVACESLGRGYFYYLCRDRRRMGVAACSNAMFVRREKLDAFILAKLEEKILSRDAVDAAYRDYFAPPPTTAAADIARAQKELTDLERKIANLMDIAEDGGRPLASVKARIAALERKRDDASARLAQQKAAAAVPVATAAERKRIRKLLDDGIDGLRLLLKQTASARQLLKDLLKGRSIQLFPQSSSSQSVRFRMESDLLPVIEGILTADASVPCGLTGPRYAAGYRQTLDAILTA